MNTLLKKEKNFNSICHSCVSENPSENKILHTAGSSGSAGAAPRMTKNKQYAAPRMTEYGRSMVEMLGVLAVMGVLSVVGVSAYNNAMNRHRANELINEASKRATVVAAQAMMGRTGTISLGEFGNNSVSSASFGATAKVENNQIKLTLSGVADPVCAQMKTALGENAIMAVDNKCTILAFNADMSRGVTVGGTSTADGWTDDDGSDCTGDTKLGDSGCQVCVNGSYVDSDAKCESGQICVDGTCKTPTGSDTGCTRNSDCTGTVNGIDCDTKTCYCNYLNYDNYKMRSGSCTGGPNKGSGVCMEATYQTTTVAADGIAGKLSTQYMDWFSAKNFCQAVEGSMVSLAGSLCTGSGTSWDCDWASLKGKLASAYWWTKNLYPGDSCKAFFVNRYISTVLYVGRDASGYGYGYALCK